MRQSRFLKFGIALISLSLIAFLVLDSAYFRVQEVSVNGNKKVASQEVIALAGLVQGTHFFSFKSGEIETLVKQNPWIARAEVSRAVPGKVRISVRERAPVAAIPYHNGFLVTDGEAYTVEFVQVAKVSWPIITGWEPVQTVVGERLDSLQVSAGLRCISQLTPGISSRLSEINVNPQGDVVIFLMGGLQVFVGQADAQATKKFSTLESLLDDFAANKMDVLYVDLRYDKPVVKLRTGASRRQGAGVK